MNLSDVLLCILADGGHRYGEPVDHNWVRRWTCVRCGWVKSEEIK